MKRVLSTAIALLVLSVAVYGQGALKVNNSTLALQLTAGELATFKTVNGFGGSGTGDAVLADANAFTGNNSFAGTSLFTGVPTIDAANEVKLSLTNDYDTFYLSIGTNTISPQIDHTFLTLGHNIESTDAGLVPIVSTKPGWGLTLENNYLNPTSGSLQTEFYFGTANSERLMVGGIAPSATASVTSVVANGAGSIVTISSPAFTPNYLREGLRFYFTALPGTASGIDTTTAYKVKTVLSATTFNLGTSAVTPVAITGATYSGTAGTMNRGGWGSTSFYQPLSVLLDDTYGSTLKSPDIRDQAAFEVSTNMTGKNNYSFFTNGKTGYGTYLWLYGDGNTEQWMIGAQANSGLVIRKDGPAPAVGNILFIDFSGNIGFGNAAPLARLNPTSTTEQLRLSYDDSNYAPFTVSSGGALTIAPSGGATTITGTLAATSLSGSGASLTGIPITAITSTTSAQMRTLVSDENGTGALLFNNASAATFEGVTIYDGAGLAQKVLEIPEVTVSPVNYFRMLNGATGGGVTLQSLGTDPDVDINLTTKGVGRVVLNTGLTTTGTIELGNATDTTLSRASAGVVAIEGSNIVTDARLAGGTLPGSFTTLAASGAGTIANGLSVGGTAYSYGAASATGAFALLVPATTYTINSGAQTRVQANYIGVPAVSNTSGVITDLFNTTIAGPPTVTGGSATRAHTLGILDSTNAASSITGGFVVATAFGTTATSVGIGGGSVYAGTSIVSSGLVQGQYFRNAAFIDYGDGGTKIAKINYNGGQELSALKLGGTTTGMRLTMASDGNVTLTDSAGTASTGNLTLNNLIAGGSTTIGSGTAISKHLSATATLNYDLTALTLEDKTITVTGAALGDSVVIGVPHGSTTATSSFTAWVSSADTVTIRCKTAATGEDPASGTFRADVWKH